MSGSCPCPIHGSGLPIISPSGPNDPIPIGTNCSSLWAKITDHDSSGAHSWIEQIYLGSDTWQDGDNAGELSAYEANLNIVDNDVRVYLWPATINADGSCNSFLFEYCC